MHLRRRHQTKSFWLGLCVLLFLGWAWFSSVHRATKLRIGSVSAPGCLIIGQSRGTVFTAFCNDPYGMMDCDVLQQGSPSGPVSVWMDHHGSPYFSTPSAISGDSGFAGWIVGIAHWFLILLYVVIWILWMRWRSRLERRFVDSVKEGMIQTVQPAIAPAQYNRDSKPPRCR